MKKLLTLLMLIPLLSFGQTEIENLVESGDAKFELEDYSGAIADYTKAIALDPENSYSFYSRGFANDNLGYSNEACSDWRKSAELGDSDAAKLVIDNCK